jgi:hypothetical protein
MKATGLSPADHVFFGRESYAVEFLIHFPYPLQADRLRRALGRTTARFWPVGGRLRVETGQPVRVEAGDGSVALTELPASRHVPDFTDPAAVAPYSVPVQSVPGEPLARFQLARVGEGSCLVASISHAVVDGYSFFYFLTNLATAYRGGLFSRDLWAQRLAPPDHRREKLSLDLGTVTPLKGEIDPDAVFRRTGIALLAHDRRMPTLREAKWEFVRFTEEELSRRLAEASRETETRLSKNDLMAALLWKQIAQRWNAAGDILEQSSPVDFRRIYTRVSPRYFGNAIRTTGVRLPREQVLESGIGWLASQIRAATAAVKPETVIDSLRCLESLRLGYGPQIMSRLHASHPTRGFLVSNMSRLPVDQLDFGGGPPRLVFPITATPRGALLTAVPGSRDILARIGVPT